MIGVPYGQTYYWYKGDQLVKTTLKRNLTPEAMKRQRRAYRLRLKQGNLFWQPPKPTTPLKDRKKL